MVGKAIVAVLLILGIQWVEAPLLRCAYCHDHPPAFRNLFLEDPEGSEGSKLKDPFSGAKRESNSLTFFEYSCF